MASKGSRGESWPFEASSACLHSLARGPSFIFTVKSHIALTSASVPTSPLTLTLLPPSYEELCDYQGNRKLTG